MTIAILLSFFFSLSELTPAEIPVGVAKQDTTLQRRSGTLYSDQYALEYITEGEGPNVLVVGSARYYDRVFSAELRKSFRFTFVDHRGFSVSEHSKDTLDYSLEKIIADMEMMRGTLGLGKVIVLGHSGHSFMALEYAKKYPENVTHVVMVGTAPDFSDENAERIAVAWEELLEPERKKKLKDHRKAMPDEAIMALPEKSRQVSFYLRESPMIWYDPDYNATWLWEGVQLDPFMSEYMWGKVFKEIDITPGLKGLKVPVFIALGRYDFLVAPPYTWEPYRVEFWEVTIRVFEKSGHTPPLEEPQAFDEALIEWVNIN